jgi:ATP-dependent DNA ligase
MIQPMLAQTGSEQDLERKDFIYEQKLDGVRCLAILDGKVELQARSGASITDKFPELSGIHRQARRPCVVDGEIACASFNGVQHRIHQESEFKIKLAWRQYPAVYHIFDILYLDGNSIETLPLIQRKAILQSVFISDFHARVLEWQTGDGLNLFANAKEEALEGIMAKQMYSPYIEGKRSSAWLKIKNFTEGTFYICGITEGENDRGDTFGSLILGEKVGDRLVYRGNVGTGFSRYDLLTILTLLRNYKGECPFETKPDLDKPVKFWTRLGLKCEVRYMASDGLLRFPSFRRLIQ